MNEETTNPLSRDEARATLAAIDAARTESSRNIGANDFGPNMIWCGLLWLVVFCYVQFLPGPVYLLGVLAVVFFVGIFVMKKLRPPSVKPAPNWRAGALCLVILVYAGIFWALLVPWDLLKHLSGANAVMLARKYAAYQVIVAMFLNVIIGLTARPNRFFVGLGLLMTALILVGYYFVPEWFMLWMGVVGGGTFIFAGVFIRKIWK